MADKTPFKPYISADKTLTEFSIVSVLLGIFIAIVFGAANAYLGLIVGLTISASIPAAVISMGVLRVLLGRKSILENNLVQTIGSAGESLAAGVIFTVPALFLWNIHPSYLDVFLMSLLGGVLGILMMIPLRRYLIVEEHGKLPYPEGTACADILIAGEEGGAKAATVFVGMGVSAVYKYLASGAKLFPIKIEGAIPRFKNAVVGMDVQPALLGVGFIIGPRIAAYMLAGAVLGWLGIIPLMTLVGDQLSVPLHPAHELIKTMDAGAMWDNYLRYIGAGAVAFAGFWSLIKSMPIILSSFRSAIAGLMKKVDLSVRQRTDRDIPMKWVLLGIVTVIILVAVLPQIHSGLAGAVLMTVFAFFFVTVSSRIVGVVGSSSNPISGMTIATLLLTTIILKALGVTGMTGMVAAISVGGLVCISSAIAGDTSQDLKTGFLLGATPWKQQLGELIGVLASALTIGYVLVLLDNAFGFGTKELAAPQATLMKLVIEGVMQGDLPWGLVFTGAAIALVVELLGIASLPFAVGLYLPFHLSAPIMLGGLIKGILDKVVKAKKENSERTELGVLYASGLIAGEGLMGLIIAAFVVKKIPLGFDKPLWGEVVALIFFGVVTASLIWLVFKKQKNVKKA